MKIPFYQAFLIPTVMAQIFYPIAELQTKAEIETIEQAQKLK